MPQHDIDLYAMTVGEFVAFIRDLLTARGYSVVWNGDGKDAGFDLIAHKGVEHVGIEIKHTKRLERDSLLLFLRQASVLRDDRSGLNECWLITSADIPMHLRETARMRGQDMRLIGRDEVTAWAKEQAALPALAKVNKQSRQRRIRLVTTSIFFALTAGGLALEIWQPKPPLDERIENVTKAISGLRDLEKQLTETKADMEALQRAKQLLEQEYAQAQELQKVSAEQLAAVRHAMQQQSWTELARSHALSFLFGVASSLLASLIWRQVGKWWSITKS